VKKVLVIIVLTAFVVSGFSQTRLERREQRENVRVIHTERGIDDPAAHAILGNVRRNFESFRSLKFHFSVITENRMEGVRNTVGNGTILMRGDSYNLSFLEMTTISDGRTVWNFNSETNEVYISRVNPDDFETMNPLMLINSYQDHFRGTLIREQMENNIHVAIIDLRPFETRNFHRVRMVVNMQNNSLVRSEIHDRDGTILIFQIDQMQTNVPTPSNQFRFDVARHPGVEVIDLR